MIQRLGGKRAARARAHSARAIAGGVAGMHGNRTHRAPREEEPHRF